MTLIPIEKDCNTCKHHTQGRSIDDAPPHCWDCVGRMGALKLDYLPKWERREPPQEPRACNTDGLPKPITLHIRKGAAARQVGGDHYKNMAIQPLEFAIANKLDFFQKDILKYITRRKGDKDKRIEDLNKAKHYIELYIDALSSGKLD